MRVTATGCCDQVDERRGILFNVEISCDNREVRRRRVLAEQLWAAPSPREGSMGNDGADAGSTKLDSSISQTVLADASTSGEHKETQPKAENAKDAQQSPNSLANNLQQHTTLESVTTCEHHNESTEGDHCVAGRLLNDYRFWISELQGLHPGASSYSECSSDDDLYGSSAEDIFLHYGRLEPLNDYPRRHNHDSNRQDAGSNEDNEDSIPSIQRIDLDDETDGSIDSEDADMDAEDDDWSDVSGSDPGNGEPDDWVIKYDAGL